MSWPFPARWSSPVISEASSLPGDYSLRLHDYEGVFPSRPDLREPGPEDPIGRLDPGARLAMLVHGELVTEGEDLGGKRSSAAEDRRAESDEGSQNGCHDEIPDLLEGPVSLPRQMLPLSAPLVSRCQIANTRFPGIDSSKRGARQAGFRSW